MAGPPRSGQTLKTHFFAYLGLLILGGALSQNLEQQEWVIIRTADGTVIATNYTWGGVPITLRTDFAKFFEDKFCDSSASRRNIDTTQGPLKDSLGYDALGDAVGRTRCDANYANRALWFSPHYGCPEPPPGKRYTCGSFGDYYCKAWGCETLTNGGWRPGGGNDKHILLVRDKSKKPGTGWNDDCARDSCNPTTVTVLNPGDPQWLKGRTWGLRLYLFGSDPGTIFTVRRLPTQGKPLLRGGTGKLPPRPPRPTIRSASQDRPSPTSIAPTEVSTNQERPPLRDPEPLIGKPHHQGESALSLLERVFPYFNSTQPSITESCWLCLSPRPPFYVGLGANTTREDMPETKPLPLDSQAEGLQQCAFESTLTLAEFRGQGTCYLLANYTLATSNYSDYCLNHKYLPRNPENLTVTIAPEGLWFVCTQGIFKCLVPTNPELCVSAYIIPQVFLYGGNPDFLIQIPTRVKRAPLLIPILATIGVVGSAAVGAGALIHGENSLKTLSATFSRDLSLLQEQVEYLERQVDSLAEVALQNRRGLDLVFLQQGGVCAALGEDCCFYANHSGIIRESIKVLTQRLKDRERETESSSWYSSLYKTSPWLTTLISALAGPLILLLLALTIGPIILNKLLTFIKDRVEAVKLLVLSQPYTILPQEEYESKV